MAVETIILICVFGGLIILCMGLSYLSQAYRAIDYSFQNSNIDSYNKNPLIKLGSKYFHWRPKGAVVISKSQWAKIESGISAEIDKAKKSGIEIGRAQLMKEMERNLSERKEKSGFPTNPYVVLGVSSNANDASITKAYNLALDLYSPKRFRQWDSAFARLARIRCKQIKKAYLSIVSGVAPSEDEDKSKSVSKGTF